MSMVYFVQAGDAGPIKIGKANDLDKRLKQMSTGCPDRMNILATIPGDRKLETRIHRVLHASRQHLEWFRPTPEVRSLALVAGKLGVSAVLRWLKVREGANEAHIPQFKPTDDFEADVKWLVGFAFRTAVARHGIAAVQAATGYSSDSIESAAKGTRDIPVSRWLSLCLLDPGVCLAAEARAGTPPAWMAEETARDALNELLGKLSVRAA